MYKPALIIGCIAAALSVILGAFGAHALKEIMEPTQLATFETGVKYQMYHSFALLFIGLLSINYSHKLVKTITLFFTLGIVLFSGSLYLLSYLKLSGIVGLGGLGIITPIGGLFFIIAWLLSIILVLKIK